MSKSNTNKAKVGKLALSKKTSAVLCSSFCVTEPRAQQFIDNIYEDIDGDQAKY